MAWKARGPEFHEFYNQQGLEPEVLKVSVLGSRRAWRTLGMLLGEMQGRKPLDIQHGKSDLKNT